MTVAPGRLFAGYRIEAVAGRGGMGVVYRAVQEGLGRPVALKLIAPELARDREFRARFVRESRLAASLDHPHVIPVYEAGEEQESLYIAMRWVEGSDLRERVVEHGPLDAGAAATVLTQVAGALDAAHARGLVHRDVKPANVLLAGSADAPHAYLSDFGLARGEASSDQLTRTGGGVLGTAAYSAPEQIEGGALDARADVYALGCVLFFVLSGRPPFRRDTELATAWAQVHDQPPTLRSVGVEVPAALELALSRALAKDPDERPATASEFAEQVRAAVGGSRPDAEETRWLGGAARIGGEARTIRLRRGRSWWRGAIPWVAGVLVVAVVGATLALVLGGGDDAPPSKQRAQAETPAKTPPPPGPAAADPAGDVVRCAGDDCTQDGEAVRAPAQGGECGDGGTWTRLDEDGDPALIACYGAVTTAAANVPDLVGARLDRAEAVLDERGVQHDTDGGGTFGIVMRGNWTVCATDPPAGDPTADQVVILSVDRTC